MRMTKFATISGLAALVFITGTAPASAYVGPGLGLGAVSTALGVVGAIILGIIAFIWYPIKRLIRRVRARFAAPAAPQVLRNDDIAAHSVRSAEEIVS